MKAIWVWATLAVGLVAAPLVVRAQAGDAPSSDETAAPAKDKEQPGESAPAVRAERADAQRRDAPAGEGPSESKGLSVQERQSRMETKLAAMRDALAHVTNKLSEARAAKDVSQRNCLNEKLTQIKGLVRISEDASVKMYDAIAANAQDAAEHEYTKVDVAHEKVKVLRAEAEQCVGELSIYSGDTEIDIEIDPDIAASDPTKGLPQPPVPEVPPVASAF